MSSLDIKGFCDERFSVVRDAFEKNLRTGQELGGAFALAIQGEYVVDIWAGCCDRERTRDWQRDTIVVVSSSTKVPVALSGLMLVDRGLIDLDAPVARYWPEFAANGKADIPVRYLFSHTSGVAGFDPPLLFEDLYDWDNAVDHLAAQAPWWEPGTVSGYHSMTFGFLIGELVRRTTGMPFHKFLNDEVFQPLAADFYVGLPESEQGRVAEIVNKSKRTVSPDSMQYRAEGFHGRDMEALLNSWEFKSAFLPSANGIGNARSLVKIGSALANGDSWRGPHLLSANTAKLAYQEQNYTHDLVMDMPVRFGLGFGLASEEFPLPFPNSFHWGGYGGSSLVMEPDRGASFAYVTNYFDSGLGVDVRGARLNRAAIACLGKL